MRIYLYFADKTLIFTDKASPAHFFAVDLPQGGRISRTKILNFLETHNEVAVCTPDPERAFSLFRQEFVDVEAAGGVVVNDRGEYLMIHRNGRWDLPKGHVEPGESTAECAVREVAEETGAADAQVVRFLCRTLHAYYMHGRWELKATHWFEMRVSSSRALKPQREEGIDVAAWCPAAELKRPARRDVSYGAPGIRMFEKIEVAFRAGRIEPDFPSGSMSRTARYKRFLPDNLSYRIGFRLRYCPERG